MEQIRQAQVRGHGVFDVGQAIITPPDRFGCIVYLAGTGAKVTSRLREETQAYVEAIGWRVVVAVEEAETSLPPGKRKGLKRALDMIEAGEAGAIVTPWRSMISPDADEYHELNRTLYAAGGFVYARGLTAPGEPSWGKR